MGGKTREILLKALDDLGYKHSENVPFELLKNILPNYVTSKLEGNILDFVFMLNEERGNEGLAYNNFYAIYVKEKDKRKEDMPRREIREKIKKEKNMS